MEVWRAVIHGVTKSRTRLSDWTELNWTELKNEKWIKGLTQLLSGQESACNAWDAGDTGSVPGLGRSSPGGCGNPRQYSCLENPLDRGACQAAVHSHMMAKSWTWLKQLSTHTHTHLQSPFTCLNFSNYYFSNILFIYVDGFLSAQLFFDVETFSISMSRAPQVAPVVKNLPANAGETRNTSLIPGSGRCPGGGCGNPLQYLAWKIPWTEEPGKLQALRLQRIRHDWSNNRHTHMQDKTMT